MKKTNEYLDSKEQENILNCLKENNKAKPKFGGDEKMTTKYFNLFKRILQLEIGEGKKLLRTFVQKAIPLSYTDVVCITQVEEMFNQVDEEIKRHEKLNNSK